MFPRKKSSMISPDSPAVEQTLPAGPGDASISSSTEENNDKNRGGIAGFIKEVLVIFLIAICISAFVQNVLARVYVIPSESMLPTLEVGDRILVEKVTYRFRSPQPGDVIVFKGTDSWNTMYESPRSQQPVIHALQNIAAFAGLLPPDENNLVKRIIAVGGQTVRCQPGDKGVTVDDHVIDSSYVLDPPVIDWGGRDNGSNACGGPYFGPITIPEGFVWVMGDNRTDSGDSRYHQDGKYHGMIPLDHIRGRTVAIIWPITRWQRVRSVTLSLSSLTPPAEYSAE